MASICTGIKVIRGYRSTEVRFLSKSGRGTQYIMSSAVVDTHELSKSARQAAVGDVIRKFLEPSA